ncbi:cytochrome c5 family protein [Sinimarinibacterium sp. CAU 1509]|nr:cytochrome c5 family protein [Sinimarinibacterium sp. CAU 1509]
MFAATGLVGCGKESVPSAPAAADPALVARLPADADLARLYEQTCKACHTAPLSGAPQSGRPADWAARLAQGTEILLDHTINGYKGMPPLGSCMDCSEDDFLALIDFMSKAD